MLSGRSSNRERIIRLRCQHVSESLPLSTAQAISYVVPLRSRHCLSDVFVALVTALVLQ